MFICCCSLKSGTRVLETVGFITHYLLIINLWFHLSWREGETQGRSERFGEEKNSVLGGSTYSTAVQRLA
jgi:hypothetical protein